MTGKPAKALCSGAVIAGLALMGASFHGVAGLDRELERAAATTEPPRTELVVHETRVREHDCPFDPDTPPRRRT